METIRSEKAEGYIKANSKGHIFTVRFIKQDGTIRDMNCRLGVKKNIKGTGNAVSRNPQKYLYVIVYDVKKRAYRMINLNTVVSIKMNGKVVAVENTPTIKKEVA